MSLRQAAAIGQQGKVHVRHARADGVVVGQVLNVHRRRPSIRRHVGVKVVQGVRRQRRPVAFADESLGVSLREQFHISLPGAERPVVAQRGRRRMFGCQRRRPARQVAVLIAGLGAVECAGRAADRRKNPVEIEVGELRIRKGEAHTHAQPLHERRAPQQFRIPAPDLCRARVDHRRLKAPRRRAQELERNLLIGVVVRVDRSVPSNRAIAKFALDAQFVDFELFGPEFPVADVAVGVRRRHTAGLERLRVVAIEQQVVRCRPAQGDFRDKRLFVDLLAAHVAAAKHRAPPRIVAELSREGDIVDLSAVLDFLAEQPPLERPGQRVRQVDRHQPGHGIMRGPAIDGDGGRVAERILQVPDHRDARRIARVNQVAHVVDERRRDGGAQVAEHRGIQDVQHRLRVGALAKIPFVVLQQVHFFPPLQQAHVPLCAFGLPVQAQFLAPLLRFKMLLRQSRQSVLRHRHAGRRKRHEARNDGVTRAIEVDLQVRPAVQVAQHVVELDPGFEIHRQIQVHARGLDVRSGEVSSSARVRRQIDHRRIGRQFADDHGTAGLCAEDAERVVIGLNAIDAVADCRVEVGVRHHYGVIRDGAAADEIRRRRDRIERGNEDFRPRRGPVVAALHAQIRGGAVRHVPLKPDRSAEAAHGAQIAVRIRVSIEAVACIVRNDDPPPEAVAANRSAGREPQFRLPVLVKIETHFAFEGRARAPGHVVDGSGECAAAVQGALRPLEDLHPFQIEQAQVCRHTAARDGQRLAGDVHRVDQNAHVRPASLRRDATDRRARVAGKHAFVECQAG